MEDPWLVAQLNYELTVVNAMVDELEQYLKSDLLYWQLSPAARISPAPPMLTIGGYMFRAHRLREAAAILSTSKVEEIHQVEGRFTTITTEWKAATERRLDREANARLNSWQWFVDDCQQRRRSSVTYYATEAELRTIIELLLDDFPASERMDAHRKRLAGLDRQFRQWFKLGDFVWQSSLQPIYPIDRFWWLYGRPDLTVASQS